MYPTSHEAVQIARQLWIRTDATTEDKEAARKAHSADAKSIPSPPADDSASPYRIIEPRTIPQRRRMIATETFWAGPHFVRRGMARDIDDKVVKRAPEYVKPALEPDEAA